MSIVDQTQRVPRPRGEIDPATTRRIRKLQQKAGTAQDELEQAVVDAHLAGASLRTIQDTFGYAQTTVLRWVAEHRGCREDAR